MQILKYKYLNGNKYKIFTDADEFILYEDIIIKYNILLKKELSEVEVNNYLKENIKYEYYYKALNFIKIRQRSILEINKYLEKNNLIKKDIDFILDKLQKQGYVDDTMFCKSYINDQMFLKNDGPLKITNNLKKLGVKEEIVLKEIKVFTKELQQEKIKKYIDKQIKLNKNKSLMILKNKLLTNLVLMGYEKEDILLYLQNININEEDLYQKEYEKLFKKLSRKYSGVELERKIKQKLYQKGFYQ